MIKDKFLRGALILTVAGLVVKFIGAFNRILLSRLLGGEGIGLYQMAYPVYLLMVSISSAGIPIAISIIVAEKVAKRDFAGASRIFRVSLGFMAIMGTLFALLLYGLANFLIAHDYIRDARAYYALIALTPAVFFATILASFRGFFQGHQMMTPPAISQIIEQFVRVVTMVALAYLLLPRGLEYAAAGAAFGALPGALTGLLVLTYFYWKNRQRWQAFEPTGVVAKQEKVSEIALRLVKLALPVSCANIMLPVVTGIDMLLVPGRLEVAGYMTEQATTQFGYFAGMGLPLVMLATIPTLSLAASIVPAVSEAFALHEYENIKKKAQTALQLCLLLTLPAMAGLLVLAEPVSLALYGTRYAALSIAHLAPAICLLGLHQVTTGILQGVGRPMIPMFNMLISIFFKIVLVWFLTADPEYGIIGAAWGTNINFGIAALLNMFFLNKYFYIALPLKQVIKLTGAALVTALTAYFAYEELRIFGASNLLSTLLAIASGACSYLIVLVISGEVDREKIKQIIKRSKK
ncbi:MAG TPA: polysaccharide biosynthesis protein [Candidatus Avacidaminococcus intestinavium]|uniref:Polysaccharide biosynthesis protein n=1 Tax=Candidatus Avacidaminococcus intestinavium TaxID=2840684 RepID=A0A9D1MPB7_9FIRM|nr:polysaccharide biosynthesis protein [Candidatus Avacidaminococcus intestinavium]